jgi:hypothetical protein
MTLSRSVSRPLWRKKRRWPKPRSGAVRNSSPPAWPLADLVGQTGAHVMQREVGIRLDHLKAQRGPKITGRRDQGGRVAERATDVEELVCALHDAVVDRTRSGGARKRMKEAKPVTSSNSRAACCAQVEGVIRRGHRGTKWRVVTFVRENQVADTHLDVISLAAEQVQRLVLRLPAKAGYGSVVAAVVESAEDTERGFLAGVENPIESEDRVRNCLDEPQGRRSKWECAEKCWTGSRNSPDSDCSRWSVGSAVDCEQRVNPAVRCTVRVFDEGRFAHRTVGRDERRQLVARMGELHLRVAPGARASDRRECVTRGHELELNLGPGPLLGTFSIFEIGPVHR